MPRELGDGKVQAMTRDELEATLQLAKSAKASGKDTPGSVALALAHAPLCEAIVQLADERDAAVRILSAPPGTVARVEGETKDETIERLHRVLHERNNAWAWERRERERAEAAEAGWKAQCDAAVKRAEEAERAADVLRLERNTRDTEAWKAAGCPPGEVSGYADRAARAAVAQRDRALALLREWCDDVEQRIKDGDCLDDDGSGRERIARGRALLPGADSPKSSDVRE